MKTIVLALTILLPAAFVHGCAREVAARDDAAEIAITDWLECLECGASDIGDVVALQAAALPSLTAALLRGPAKENRDSTRRELAKSYSELVRYVSTTRNMHAYIDETGKIIPFEEDMPMTLEEYVSLYSGNYDALYRIRAAQALSALGGAPARAALRRAAENKGLRDDVREVIASLVKERPR